MLVQLRCTWNSQWGGVLDTATSRRAESRLWVVGVCLMTFIGISLTAHAMTPSLMRAKELKQGPNGDFWEVRITCSDLETRRFIMQTEEKGEWCARDVPGLCDEEKIGAAMLVCAPEYRTALEEAQRNGTSPVAATPESDANAEQRARLLQERVALQQQRLDLAEKKLEISRREMDLREREVNLLERKSRLSE